MACEGSLSPGERKYLKWVLRNAIRLLLRLPEGSIDSRNIFAILHKLTERP
jgi:hypothetical protein